MDPKLIFPHFFFPILPRVNATMILVLISEYFFFSICCVRESNRMENRQGASTQNYHQLGQVGPRFVSTKVTQADCQFTHTHYTMSLPSPAATRDK